MSEHTEEFFKTLTMKLSEKDDALYSEWALWCAKSNLKYYIDGRSENGEIVFFTYERTAPEIQTMKHLENLREFIKQLDPEDPIDEEYIRKANRYLELPPKVGRFIQYDVFRRKMEAAIASRQVEEMELAQQQEQN